jgi:hypothetical protein
MDREIAKKGYGYKAPGRVSLQCRKREQRHPSGENAGERPSDNTARVSPYEPQAHFQPVRRPAAGDQKSAVGTHPGIWGSLRPPINRTLV